MSISDSETEAFRQLQAFASDDDETERVGAEILISRIERGDLTALAALALYLDLRDDWC